MTGKITNGQKKTFMINLFPGHCLTVLKHPDFNHSVSINYNSWDDTYIHGFTVEFNNNEAYYEREVTSATPDRYNSTHRLQIRSR